MFLDAERSDIRIAEDGRVELHYYDSVVFRYRGAVLHCDTAVWYEDRGILEFWSNVRYADSLRHLSSSHLRYFQAENRIIATGACELIDRSERTRIRGERVDFDRRTEELLVTGHPCLAIDYDDPVAMIEITSETLRYASAVKYGEAMGNVRIIKGTMAATCDTCEFFPDSNLITLRGSPYAWQGHNELEGDTMHISLAGRQIDQISVSGACRALYRKEAPYDNGAIAEPDTSAAAEDLTSSESDTSAVRADSLSSTGRHLFTESRIESRTITFFLEDEVLSKIISAGNSYSWYTPAPGDTVAEGRNEASGDSIVLYFTNSELERVEIDHSCVGQFFSQMTIDSLGEINYLDTVSYESSRLCYEIADRIISLTGNAQVSHGTVTLLADTITYNTSTKDLRALSTSVVKDGDSIYVPVLLRDGLEEMTGERLVYNLDTRKGKIKESDTEIDRAFYHGRILRKVDEDVLFVECGKYIPCEYRDANFHFWSSRMKIISGDKVIARPVVLYIENLPVLYAPFFVFSIKKGRHSGFLPFRVGSWERGGRYVRNLGYYWAISDYFDLETSMYAEESIGVGFNGTLNYCRRYVMRGTVKGSFVRDAATGFYGRNIRYRWSLDLNHSHTLTPSASISGSGSFVSDKDYTTAVSNDVQERLNRNLRSQLNFSKRWEGSSFTAAIQSTRALDTEASSLTMPQLSFRLNSRTLANPPAGADKSEYRWYHNTRISYNSDFINYWSESGSGDGLRIKEYAKATQNVALNSPQTILRYVTMSPSISHTENLFRISPNNRAVGNNIRTDRLLRSWTSRVSLSSNTSIYGHFAPPIPGLVGIRHSLTPSISFGYTPKSDRNSIEAGYVGASWSRLAGRSLGLTLYNLFQMKYRSGGNDKKLDLFSINTSAGYNFEAVERKWSTVATTIRSSTIPFVTDVTIQATHDLYNPETRELNILGARMTSFSISSGFTVSGSTGGQRDTDPDDDYEAAGRRSDAKPWSLTCSYRYGESRAATSSGVLKSIAHWITTDARFNLTENFSIIYSQNYDIRRQLVVDRAIRITRDMRCWQAEFSWNPNGSREGYFFRIFLKQLPDVKLEKSQSPLRGTLYD